MTDSRLDDLEKRLTSLQEEVRGGLAYLDWRLDRFSHKMRICFADVVQTQDLEEEQPTTDVEAQKEDAGSVDWREELYQKIQSMNELYFEPLNELYQDFAQTVQKETAPDNEYEKSMRSYIIPPNEITVTNEFMIHWDGLLTKSEERILVLAATNRPFNLDEAIIRRFERRIMVGFPSLESRELILRTLLSKENAEQLDVKELSTMTVGYSSSDLKNLCVAAAYRPLRELIQREKSMRLKKQSTTEEQSIESATACRSLNMEDFREAMNQIKFHLAKKAKK
ncbi:hypothetical protein C4D60_Mb11t18020 [Musa balbisiana]|uniref:AAA ATPase AAA+ lid domain-containing protein n=1 Tax=Musa balbisiana TaxID=52838 RepID=A0A4S8J4X5_MUSBA|nr:hypothetical protein C4D60_Mb11t18020 [Musa balbisiana]